MGKLLTLICTFLISIFSFNFICKSQPLSPPGGDCNTVLNFDGIDDYIQLNSVLDIGNISNTVELWVKIPEVGTGNLTAGERVGIILGNYDDNPNAGWEIHDDGQLRLYWNSYPDVYGTTDLRDNQWHHIAFVRDMNSSTLKAYIDGEVEFDYSYGGVNLDFVTTHRIGADNRGSGTPYFHGSMDELRIWSVAKSQEEIQASMNNTLDGTEDNLELYFDFQDGVNSETVYDLSSNSFLGTTTNIDLETSWQTAAGDIGGSGRVVEIASSCDAYEWRGQTYETSGFYYEVIENSYGCDSTLVLDFTRLEASSSTFEATGYISYEWIDGNVYTEDNNTATYTIDNYLGCDSVITLDLTIETPEIGGGEFNNNWAYNIAESNIYSEAISISTDDNNNVYTVGFFVGNADFDPKEDIYELTTSEGSFIQKQDSEGLLLWAKKIDTEIYSSATDLNANLYIVGELEGTINLGTEENPIEFTSSGEQDAIIIKFDTDGNFLWLKQIGGAGSYTTTYSLDIDASGNVYVTGNFNETVDFNPGEETFEMTSNGGNDIFVEKLDVDGNFVWAKQMGGSNYDTGYSISIDENGNVFSSGYAQGTVDFDPSENTYELTSTYEGILYIQKLDTDGNFIWAQKVESDGNIYTYAVSIDIYNNVFIYGTFEGTADFDASEDTYELTADDENIFIQKLDTDGNFIWARQIEGSIGDSYAKTLETDEKGYVYATGNFSGTIDFNLGGDAHELTALGNYDVFIQKLNNEGELIWAKQIGGTESDVDSHVITVDNNLNVLVGGYFENTVDFDPEDTKFNLTARTYGTGFILKLTCTPTTSTDVIEACSSYEWIDGITYTESNNTATYTTTNMMGCDSVITLNLTILQPTASTDTVVLCSEDSYEWIDGITYTENNNSATFTTTNEAGCDSVITLNLTFGKPSASTDVISACGNYEWIDGITYTESNNTATYTTTNLSGCDSVITLNLTINNVDAGVSIEGTLLTASADGASYQWVDADNEPIEGATSKTFTPTENGSYAVIVTQNDCSVTSESIEYNVLGVVKSTFEKNIIVYPNPTYGEVEIEIGETIQQMDVRVMNVTGQVVNHKVFKNTGNFKINIDGATGIYFIEMMSNDAAGKSRSAIIRIVKQ
ncbi:LamG-like jellyroll fold domain-containing protein [Chondrinema litorale]|uniref:LamG-like jellyroll fold domain-containing protein n=1 Tax=Chondrinema litorale TaxID=2994555 RepID=UPI0025428E47|nr:LamG-like jellyroll fold domain-containing protein [Chondrinema litorale]UZR96533.1 SBBP repeat-containing protein [Chondrinema litorale]